MVEMAFKLMCHKIETAKALFLKQSFYLHKLLFPFCNLHYFTFLSQNQRIDVEFCHEIQPLVW